MGGNKCAHLTIQTNTWQYPGRSILAYMHISRHDTSVTVLRGGFYRWNERHYRISSPIYSWNLLNPALLFCVTSSCPCIPQSWFPSFLSRFCLDVLQEPLLHCQKTCVLDTISLYKYTCTYRYLCLYVHTHIYIVMYTRTQIRKYMHMSINKYIYI